VKISRRKTPRSKPSQRASTSVDRLPQDSRRPPQGRVDRLNRDISRAPEGLSALGVKGFEEELDNADMEDEDVGS
jgi:hypothetical protein